MKNKVAIVGFGWVGKAMYELFPDSLIYSPRMVRNSDGDYVEGSLEQWEQDREKIQQEINEQCSVAFVCVPTPCPNESKLDTRAVEEAVAWLDVDLIVIRSTVNPGDTDFLKAKYGKHIVMQPEYLGETPAHPLLDTAKTPFMIIGGDWKDRQKLIELYATVYNANISIRPVSCYAAEIIKLCENRAIAFKVAQIQELYDVCKAYNIDYYTIREAVYGDDPRFDLWWTFVYPGNRGFNSKCIPKDIYAFCAWAESAGYNPAVTRAILEKNKHWIQNLKSECASCDTTITGNHLMDCPERNQAAN